MTFFFFLCFYEGSHRRKVFFCDFSRNVDLCFFLSVKLYIDCILSHLPCCDQISKIVCWRMWLTIFLITICSDVSKNLLSLTYGPKIAIWESLPQTKHWHIDVYFWPFKAESCLQILLTHCARPCENKHSSPGLHFNTELKRNDNAKSALEFFSRFLSHPW